MLHRGNVLLFLQQGAVSVNSEKISSFDTEMEVATGDVVKVGKRKWFKVKIVGNRA